ncbi:hypothetical protein HR060_07745 [Catenovulum sp. SM1970]|uniref:hypothetical protein n=1 Tax=Marinifaba aquimaris TaxID=2741323 RepID=UPI001572D0CE|nr:hypothetical protein [Marinifaba aquimaris]NTS76761.1 hypothetical protein [Marinifaba aquimaris]
MLQLKNKIKLIGTLIGFFSLIIFAFIGLVYFLFAGDETTFDYKVNQFISGELQLTGKMRSHYEGAGYDVTVSYLPVIPPYGPFKIANFHYISKNNRALEEIDLQQNYQIYKVGSVWQLAISDSHQVSKVFESENLKTWNEVDPR